MIACRLPSASGLHWIDAVRTRLSDVDRERGGRWCRDRRHCAAIGGLDAAAFPEIVPDKRDFMAAGVQPVQDSGLVGVDPRRR